MGNTNTKSETAGNTNPSDNEIESALKLLNKFKDEELPKIIENIKQIKKSKSNGNNENSSSPVPSANTLPQKDDLQKAMGSGNVPTGETRIPQGPQPMPSAVATQPVVPGLGKGGKKQSRKRQKKIKPSNNLTRSLEL